jgi:hypothetical protein
VRDIGVEIERKRNTVMGEASGSVELAKRPRREISRLARQSYTLVSQIGLAASGKYLRSDALSQS